MKNIAMAALLFAALSSVDARPLLPRQRQGLEPKVRPNGTVRPAFRRSVVEDAVYAFYVKQFQQDPEVSPEILAKMLPFIDHFVTDRFAISQRRTRALNQLRQAMNRRAPDDELRRLVHELDTADSDFQANQEKFLSNVDPLLNARLQAKVRILQNMADNRLRQLLDAVQQNPAAPRPNAPQATSPN